MQTFKKEIVVKLLASITAGVLKIPFCQTFIIELIDKWASNMITNIQGLYMLLFIMCEREMFNEIKCSITEYLKRYYKKLILQIIRVICNHYSKAHTKISIFDVYLEDENENEKQLKLELNDFYFKFYNFLQDKKFLSILYSREGIDSIIKLLLECYKGLLSDKFTPILSRIHAFIEKNRDKKTDESNISMLKYLPSHSSDFASKIIASTIDRIDIRSTQTNINKLIEIQKNRPVQDFGNAESVIDAQIELFSYLNSSDIYTQSTIPHDVIQEQIKSWIKANIEKKKINKPYDLIINNITIDNIDVSFERLILLLNLEIEESSYIDHRKKIIEKSQEIFKDNEGNGKWTDIIKDKYKKIMSILKPNIMTTIIEHFKQMWDLVGQSDIGLQKKQDIQKLPITLLFCFFSLRNMAKTVFEDIDDLKYDSIRKSIMIDDSTVDGVSGGASRKKMKTKKRKHKRTKKYVHCFRKMMQTEQKKIKKYIS